MELTQLQYFRTVANTGSMTKAAEQLHLTQPALSRTISRLEDDLGVKLFNRAGNRIMLSHEGRVFLFRVEQFLSELDDGVKEIQDMSSEGKGHISFIMDTPGLLNQFLAHYLSAYPELQVFTREANPLIAVNAIEERSVDFAILSQQPAAPRIQWKELIEEPYLMLVSKSDPLSDAEKIDLTEAERKPFIFTHSTVTPGVYGDTVTQFCNLAGFEPKVSYKGMTSEIVYQLVAGSRGVLLVPASIWYCSASPALANARHSIKALKISYPRCRSVTGIATLRGGYVSRAAASALESLNIFYRDIRNKLSEYGVLD